MISRSVYLDDLSLSSDRFSGLIISSTRYMIGDRNSKNPSCSTQPDGRALHAGPPAAPLDRMGERCIRAYTILSSSARHSTTPAQERVLRLSWCCDRLVWRGGSGGELAQWCVRAIDAEYVWERRGGTGRRQDGTERR